MNKRIMIAGSGLTGATLAFLHRQNGDYVKVFERRNRAGGNCYTEDVGGIEVHRYGAHIFHTDKTSVWKFITRFGDFNHYVHTVKTRLNGRVYSLPVNMNTFNEVFGIGSPTDVGQEHTDMLYDMFFAGYTRKQWGGADVSRDVVRRIPVRRTFDNRYFNDAFQGIPIDGYSSLLQKMLCGVEIIYGIDFNTVVGEHLDADVIYHTGMIDEFMSYSLGELGYRSLDFRTECLSVSNYQGCTVMNEASEAVPYTRTIEHKWFNPKDDVRGTVITREYPMPWVRGREAYYVVNNDKNNSLYERYKQLVAAKYPNMIFCGRLGGYQYLDMDDAVNAAIGLFYRNKD